MARRIRFLTPAGAVLLGSAAVLCAAGPALALTLNADITNLADGDEIHLAVTARGVAYNADAEGALTAGGLQAFYRKPLGWDITGASFPLPDMPGAGELTFGTHSEFAANPPHSNNWWVTDDQAFRNANGIPGTPTGEYLPPYLMRKYLGQLSNGVPDDTSVRENFTIRMAGKIVIPSDNTYSFNGWGDDAFRVYVDGRKVHDQHMPNTYNGQVQLAAGEHGFVAEFTEFGGGQWYQLVIPAGTSLKANAQHEHTFAGRTLEYGRTFAEKRPGLLTARFESGASGGAPIGNVVYYAEGGGGNFANDWGPSPQGDNYRMYSAGYWYVPANGTYTFRCGADDLSAFAISDNPNADPWTIARVVDDESGDWVPSAGIALTEGWRPVRFEFGEGGGGAWYRMDWSDDGGANWHQFPPDELMSTDDPVYDWTLLGVLPDAVSSEADLLSFDLPPELLGQVIDLRLRAVGTDHTYSEEIVSQLQVVPEFVIPEPATMALLGIGGLGLLIRRRRQA